MVRWIVGSFLHGGTIELFLQYSNQCSTTGVTKVAVCVILSVKEKKLLSALLNKTFPLHFKIKII